MATDFELLDQWADGDSMAARELVDRHFKAVYRFFARKTAVDVEDLVQETFAACVAARDRFRRQSSFRSYLIGMARNKLLHHYRDRKALSDLSEVGESRLMDLEPSPSSLVGHKRQERVLIEALRRLPLDYQLVIELYAWEGLTGPEVAVALEITEAAMRSRLHRAKQQLRRELESLGESEALLESTMANLDAWAQGVREPEA